MNDPALLDALVLGIVEGLTEFLPVSSTGHLILVSGLLGFGGERAKVFEIVIQTGAMAAIVVEYRHRFGRAIAGALTDRAAQRFWLHLAVAFLPAAILGLSFGGLIKAHLFGAMPVALAFIIGGLIILWVERRRLPVRIETADEMTWKDGLKVGLEHRQPGIPLICLETALPVKFAETLREALGREPQRPQAFENLEKLPQRFTVMERDAAALKRYIEQHGAS